MYLDQIKEIQATTCPELKPSTTVNGTVTPTEIGDVKEFALISNLDAENWVYGTVDPK